MEVGTQSPESILWKSLCGDSRTYTIMVTKDFDVVIVGAGAIGCSTALELAPDHDVLVLEKGLLTNSASANASAFISDWWLFLGRKHVPGATDMLHEFFSDFDGTGEFEYHDHPYIELVAEEKTASQPDQEVEALKESIEDIDGISFNTATELEDRWPGALDLTSYEGGFVDDRAGVIDPVHYLRAMKEQAEEMGVEFRMQTEVTELVSDGNSVVGVETEHADEPIYADDVVVAAGVHTDDLVSEFADLPMGTFVIYGATLQSDTVSAEAVPTVSNDQLMVGPDVRGNFTTGIEYWVDGPESIPPNLPQEGLLSAAEHIPDLLNDFGDVLFLEDQTYKCPEGITVTPDQLPVIEELTDGLVVADGSRGAVALSPVIAAAITATITGGETPFSLDHFSMNRFDSDVSEVDIPFVEEAPQSF
ncbi:FAD-binding oxidoreductase [Haloarculaceae archaeon H-GB11]|nr:FAD-binding oxidoreductase [Haloarculaceae archaeon H-GB11]